MEEKANKTVKAVSFMIMITLLGKVLGLIRDQLMAANYAFSPEATAFLTASRIPRLFFDAVFASAISASFIPIFNEYMQRKGKEEAFRLSNRFITLIGIVTCVMTVLGILFARPLVWLVAGGFDPETALICETLLRALFPSVIFTGLAFSFVGILQSLDEFGIPAAMSVASNLVIIVYYIFFNEQYGVYGLTAAFLIGWMMQAAIQIPALLKKGYRYRPSFQFRDEGMKKIGKMMLPVMVSTWIQPINLLINTKVASYLFVGAITAIEYANTLYSILTGVFVLSIANVIFPKLARMASPKGNDENGQSLGNTVGTTISAMLFLLLPMMAGLCLLSEPIVRLMFQWGDFAAYETAVTSKALFYFSFGMIGFGVQTVLSRAFYAVQDGKTPFYSGLVSIAVNLALCLLLAPKMDVGGLALASSASSVVAALLLWLPMVRNNPEMVQDGFWSHVCKMVAATLLMSAVVVLIYRFLITSLSDDLVGRILVVGVPAGIGVLLYMSATYFLKLPESRAAFSIAGKMLRRGK